MKIDQDLFFRFFSRESGPQETDALTAWLKEDPAHEEEFNKAYELFVISQVMANADIDEAKDRKYVKKPKRWIHYAVSVVAAVVIGMFIENFFFMRPVVEKVDSTFLVSEAQPGHRTSVTLSDGTVVELNSGSRIEYPAIFHKGERRIRLEGEAMFDVAHDEDHPFIVETFAYDVKVLGTRFDVIADSDRKEFTAALLEGKINIRDKADRDIVTLRPDMMATLQDGKLVCSRLTDRDAYLWTDGVISAAGVPFRSLMDRFERCYGVNIEIAADKHPEVRYVYFKLRISEGIDHALKLLQDASDFDYRYNEETNTYIIY